MGRVGVLSGGMEETVGWSWVVRVEPDLLWAAVPGVGLVKVTPTPLSPLPKRPERETGPRSPPRWTTSAVWTRR